MILTDSEAQARLNSPINLINRLSSLKPKNSAMGLFGINSSSLPSLRSELKPEVIREIKATEDDEVKFKFNSPKELKLVTPSFTPSLLPTLDYSVPEPTLDKILESGEAEIKLSLAHDKALSLLNHSVQMLANKLDDVSAAKLPSVITAAGKVVESIRKERLELNKKGEGKAVHYHFYTPQQKQISDYEVIEVS